MTYPIIKRTGTVNGVSVTLDTSLFSGILGAGDIDVQKAFDAVAGAFPTYSSGRIPYVNAGATAYSNSANLTFDGSKFQIKGSTGDIIAITNSFSTPYSAMKYTSGSSGKFYFYDRALFTGLGDAYLALKTLGASNYIEMAFADYQGNNKWGIWYDNEGGEYGLAYSYDLGKDLLLVKNDGKMSFGHATPDCEWDFRTQDSSYGTSTVYSGNGYFINDPLSTSDLVMQFGAGTAGDVKLNFGNPDQRDVTQILTDFTADGGSGSLAFAVQNGTVMTLLDGSMQMGSTASYMSDTYLKSDSAYLFFGAGNDAKVWYDGTDFKVDSSLVAPSDVHIQCGTDKTVVLDETVWVDIDFPIIVRTTGANIPALTTLQGNITAPQWQVNDFNVCEGQELIHSWKEGTPLYWHCHLITNGLDATDRYVRFEVEYCWVSPNGILSSATTIDSGDLLIPANTTSKTMMIMSIGNFTPTGGKIGGQVYARLRRIASTGTAPTNDCWITMLQAHIQCDTIGSRQIGVK